MVTIYALTCMFNGKAYIGCTAGNIAKRFREHRCMLNTGLHTEPDLLADWLLHGAQNFIMRSIIILEDDATLHAKRCMEKFVMGQFKTRGLLYNRNESCFEPTRAAQLKGQPLATATVGNKYGSQANAKRRASSLGIPKNHGAKISATKQAKKAMR